MFPNRKNAIIGGSVIAVAAAIALSWGFAANGGSSGAAAGGNWASIPLLTVIVGIFGVIFAFFQTYMLFAIRQLSNQMGQMDARLTNQIGELEKRMHERFVLIEGRFTQLENRIDNRIDGLENRIDSRFAQVEERFTQVDIRLDNIHQNYVDDMKYRLREE